MMDFRSTLHWSALVLAVFAAIWMLSPFSDAIGALVIVSLLFGAAGFILALVHARHIPTDDRTFVYTGAIIGLVAFAGWIFLRIVSLPIAVNTGETNATTAPPAFLGSGADFLGSLLPSIGALAIALTFWPVWGQRDRILGGGGAGLVILIQLLTFVIVTGSDALALVFEMLFALGFLLIFVALVLSLVTPSHRAWAREEHA